VRGRGADEEWAAAGVLRLKERHVRRHLRDHVGDVADAQAVHAGVVDDGGRRRRVVTFAANSGAGDDDFFFWRRYLRRRDTGEKEPSPQQAGDTRGQHGLATVPGTLTVCHIPHPFFYGTLKLTDMR